MAIDKPNLVVAQPGAPITAHDWNAMIQAVKGLHATLQNLRTRAPLGILVTVRDQDSKDILAAELVAQVYATSLASNTPMPPGQRATGHDQAYLIPVDKPGDYAVTVEPAADSGYQQQTATVTVGEDIALKDFMLSELPQERLVPMIFGKTLREARAILATAHIPVQRMLDAHGAEIDADTWEADYGNRLVVGTEPGAGLPVDEVDILVAGRVEPAERRPVLVGQIPVARPTRLALSPDGSRLYVLSQGSAQGGGSAITVVDTRKRRIVTTIDTGNTPLMNLVCDPAGKRLYVSAILPELTLAGGLVRDLGLSQANIPLAMADPRLGILRGDSAVNPGDRSLRAATPNAGMGLATSGMGGMSAGISLGGLPKSDTAAGAGAIQAASLSGKGAALNQLVTEAGGGAAFSAGVANLAASNLVAALGRGIKARGNQGAIVVVDTAENRLIAGRIVSTVVCYGLSLSTDGDTLYGTAPTQNRAVRINLNTSQVEALVSEGMPAFVEASDQAVYITDVGRHLLLQIPYDGAMRAFPAGISPQDLAVTPDERYAYLVNFNLQNGSLVRVNLKGSLESAPEPILGVAPRVINQDGFLLSGVDITPDGGRICVAVEGGLAVINAGTQAVQNIALGGDPAGVLVEPLRDDRSGGKYAYVANFSGNVVQIVDLTGQDEPFTRTTIIGSLFNDRISELMTVPGINEHVAGRLVLSGIKSIGELAAADNNLVKDALESHPVQATTLIARAKRLTVTNE